MSNTRIIWFAISTVVLLVILGFGITGAQMDRNPDMDSRLSAEDQAEVKAGAQKVIERYVEGNSACDRAKKEAQEAWDQAVQSGETDEHSRDIDAMDAKVKEICSQ